MMIRKLKAWLESHTYYACQGYWSDCTPDNPSEFDCDAGYAGEFTCEDCLVNGGMYNPDTGKKDYIRYFFMNYKCRLRHIFKIFKNCDGIYRYCVYCKYLKCEEQEKR